MAVDTALMATATRTGRGIWRCYRWSRPTVSFGRNETVRGRCTADALTAAGLDAVRRPTGGRALLHAAELTYSVAVPMPPGVPWTRLYGAVNAILLDALQALGVPATLAERADGDPLRPVGPVCFDQPAEGEITVHGAKLVGSAVWRDRGAYLQHGSILLENAQDQLRDLLPSPPATPAAQPPATLTELLPTCPSPSAVAEALERALVARMARSGGSVAPLPSDELSADDVTALTRHYHAPDWLWRR